MSCRFSREQLALYVGGDLCGAAEELTARHLVICAECQEFLDQLRRRQALLKSLRQPTVMPTDYSRMRRNIMAIISAQPDRASWPLRLERALWLGIRRRPYALATAALLVIVSVTAVAQRRPPVVEMTRVEAFFLPDNALTRPDGYRAWILVGSGAAGTGHRDTAGTDGAGRKVYINPAAYRQYAKNGTFPEGTQLVWEASAQERAPSRSGVSVPVLLVSVKDSTRFADGWGFFDFTVANGETRSKAEPATDLDGCRTCHQRDAATDHVFIQSYPVLQAAHRLS